MKGISSEEITERIKKACIEANSDLEGDVMEALKAAREKEVSPIGKEILSELIENAELAREDKVPICQDTGFAVFFVEMGEEVRIEGNGLIDAIIEGVKKGYEEGYLRKSICDPLSRKNTGDNTPPIVHLELVKGEGLKIILAPKGGGSENMSRIKMLSPSEGLRGIEEFVLETVRLAGANPCPPIVVGVGIGGTFEKAAIIAKKSLLRPLGSHNPDPSLRELEEDWLDKVNRLGIGPQGLGGRITALALHIEVFPCHIASLPVAVNINCHAHRHKEIIL